LRKTRMAYFVLQDIEEGKEKQGVTMEEGLKDLLNESSKGQSGLK